MSDYVLIQTLYLHNKRLNESSVAPGTFLFCSVKYIKQFCNVIGQWSTYPRLHPAPGMFKLISPGVRKVFRRWLWLTTPYSPKQQRLSGNLLFVNDLGIAIRHTLLDYAYIHIASLSIMVWIGIEACVTKTGGVIVTF